MAKQKHSLVFFLFLFFTFITISTEVHAAKPSSSRHHHKGIKKPGHKKGTKKPDHHIHTKGIKKPHHHTKGIKKPDHIKGIKKPDHIKGIKKPDQSSKDSKKLLFVFGDSYVDTGNWKKSVFGGPWEAPYGITFPGKPAGRFSDGRVLTDYIASFLGIRSPLPFQWRKIRTKKLKFGMNFAYGGTGVFNTLVKEPNMTTQINFFQQLLKEKMYSKQDLYKSSIALVTLAGNDYSAYSHRNGSKFGIPSFTTSVINKLASNLKRIHGLGVRKIAVTAIEPIGCLPFFTSLNSYQNCNDMQNNLAKTHNHILREAVQKLNNESNNSSFVILDLYGAFMSALTKQGSSKESLKYKYSLKPCCLGASNKDLCGSIDKKGVKKYKVCKRPETVFFWDMVHPSQKGWHAIYSALRPSLHRLY